ncbi:hypothetical protein FN846DRAFT_916773 [Sphaerosporella brunnea]|uniref:JmjC domain-containing histone demethylation protein 1 n=1 Tax=Sphaerosporella brunnea TaxID=1250544 RepID=A0A5J5F6J1_9PEZI|nr:hypothetical protein FN846DRAFT_916773 [Sphaerosporella brunnea]
MASQKPYGARWGFRTPSPDFARTAVEPLSPLPAAASPYGARTPSFSSSYVPPPVQPSYSPQYSAVSRSFRGPDPAPQPPLPSYSHGYMLSSPVDRYPQKLQGPQNPLDALADIALMHGASRLAPGPSYNPPPLSMPTLSSPTFVAAVPSSTWPRPDSAQPPVSPRTRDVAHIPAEPRRTSFSTDPREPSYSFGTIGQERRSVSRTRELGGPSNVDSAVTLPPIARSLPVPAQPLPALQPEPAATEASVQATADDPLSAPKTEESRHPWINASPIDEYLPCPKDVDNHGHSITLSQPKAAFQPIPNTMDGFLGSDFTKSGTASLPTPTQEDHVIVSSESPADLVVQEVPNIEDSVAKLTPEITEETEILPEATVTVEEPPAPATDEAPRDELMAAAQPLTGAALTTDEAQSIHLSSEEPAPENAETSEVQQAVDDSRTEGKGGNGSSPAISVVIYTQPKEEPPPRTRRSSSRIPRTTAEPKKSNRKVKGTGESASILEPRVGGEDDCRTCKVHFSEDDGRNGAWIGCDGCKGWHHARCVGLDQATVDKIDKFYCISCEPTHGKSTMKRSSGRARTAIDYEALHHGSSAPVKNPEDPRIHPWINKIINKEHPFAEDDLQRLKPELVTPVLLDGRDGYNWTEPFIVPAKWNPTPWHANGEDPSSSATARRSPETFIPPPPRVPQNGTRRRTGSPFSAAKSKITSVPDPVSVESEKRADADALDLRIPSGLTVRRVAELIGPDTHVPVMNVVTQDAPSEKWTIGRLADYFESPVKDAIYNCISCEVSNGPMGDMISRPKAVRETDLVDRVWQYAGSSYVKPTVGKYVLMSVKDSFTDFHVDFAGSSVFYHIYEGQKVFLAIPPTEKALKAYQTWSSSPSMNYTFLPDLIPDIPCKIIALNKGDTFFIPSGWIHAVYTPVDSLVIGGNFLTKNFYVNQMRIYNIEAITGVPATMRYPRYTTLMWCTMFHYINTDRMPKEVEKEILHDVIGRKTRLRPSKQMYSTEELKGLPSLLDFLYRNVMIIMGVITTSQRPGGQKLLKNQVENVKKAVPWPINRAPLQYLKHFARWCLWKRACAEIVSGGEKLPEWAGVNWMPSGTSAASTADSILEMPPPPANGDEGAPARRGGLRERSKFSVSPEENLEDFDYFPNTAAIGVNGSRRSSSVAPRRGSSVTPRRAGSVAPVRRASTPATGAIKKTKLNVSTRRNRTSTPMPTLANKYKEQVETLKLTDGSLYVKKLSNLGPPRIGCESCRQKKTGCKHKEEIRARGWCDDDRATTQDVEPAQAKNTTEGTAEAEETPSQPAADKTPEKPAKQSTPSPRAVTEATPGPSAPTPRAARQSQTPAVTVKSNSSGTMMGPPAGYKGRKPSCEDCKALKKKCLHQDTWKLVQDKQAAAEAKKALKKHEQTHRRQAKESKRKATVQQKAAQQARPETPPPKQQEPEGESIVLRTPQTPARAAVPPSPREQISPLKEKGSEAVKPVSSPAIAAADVAIAPVAVASPPPPPSVKGKERATDDLALSLDTSILAEAPQYTSTSGAPGEDPSIMAPPMDVENVAQNHGQPRTVPSPTMPANLQKEYIAALHQRAKITYSSGGRSIKRKAEDESPEHAVRPMKKEGGVDGTTFESLRSVSLGLRVRGGRGNGGSAGGAGGASEGAGVVVGGV